MSKRRSNKPDHILQSEASSSKVKSRPGACAAGEQLELFSLDETQNQDDAELREGEHSPSLPCAGEAPEAPERVMVNLSNVDRATTPELVIRGY